VARANLVGKEKRPAHQDRDDDAGNQTESENGFLHVKLLVQLRMESRCGAAGADVVILSDDFREME